MFVLHINLMTHLSESKRILPRHIIWQMSKNDRKTKFQQLIAIVFTNIDISRNK